MTDDDFSLQGLARAKSTMWINVHIQNRVREIEQHYFLACRGLQHAVAADVATFGGCYPRDKRLREGVRRAAGSYRCVRERRNNCVAGHLNTLRGGYP